MQQVWRTVYSVMTRS